MPEKREDNTNNNNNVVDFSKKLKESKKELTENNSDYLEASDDILQEDLDEIVSNFLDYYEDTLPSGVICISTHDEDSDQPPSIHIGGSLDIKEIEMIFDSIRNLGLQKGF